MELQAALEHIDDDTVVLHITLPVKETGVLIEQFTIQLAYQRTIQPEEGQTTYEAAVQQVGADQMDSYLRDAIMRYAFSFAAEHHGVEIVGKPTLRATSEIAQDSSFSFDAFCVCLPAFELTSYDPVEISVPPLEVADQEIDRYLDTLRQKHASLEEETGRNAVQAGDLAELCIETYRDGERCDQLCSEARTYTTGANQMPEGFDAGVIGMAVGETKTIDYECPGIVLNENNEPEMERYTSTVTVNKLQKLVVPELTDEWICEHTEAHDEASLRKGVREAIAERKTIEYRHYRNLQSVIKLAERFEGAISNAVYRVVSDDIVQAFEDQLVEQGTTREDFLRQQGVTDDELTAHLMGQVQEQLARQFALDAVARHFSLQVNDQDLDEYFKAASQPGLEAMIRMSFERDGRMMEARRSALRLKANDFITEQAVVHIVEN